MKWLAIAAILLYFAASWRLLRSGPNGAAPVDRPALLLGLNGGVLHIAFHIGTAMQANALALHFFLALSLVSAAMALVGTAVSFARHFDALGRVLYPFAAVLLAAAVLSYRAPPAGEALSWPLKVHALLALLAYATLALAALFACALWFQERLLRARALQHPLLRLLPPLVELESLMFRSIEAGFVLLTVALTIGAVFVENLFAQHLVHKTVLSVLSWSVFGALLIGRMRYGWRGRRAVTLTLLAMGLLLLAFFGSKFVLELVLNRNG
ncbi:cytochrome C assembly family protein [Pseudomarimonas arenosa]|uniref:Cytochrome c biogenesis protein CcsA n=1 Tax=Pseudomarimonas arenosa TaxID=2774145 RepID=A0AAW3ZJC8_9GAMM|nr:cytochrome c biogenesis protein CcsA [Pseudomarimonas arenosa]MBD8526185.1 cytochrome c biogenesis protein CcsA [Pseudomarimonas arenosa]